MKKSLSEIIKARCYFNAQSLKDLVNAEADVDWARRESWEDKLLKYIKIKKLSQELDHLVISEFLKNE